MRPFLCVVTVLAFAAVALAQAPAAAPPAEQQSAAERPITHGELALLLLQALGTKADQDYTPAAALVEVQRLELVPQSWQVDDLLTQGEFADVLQQIGAHYVPSDREELASAAFVEAMLRRELGRLRDYLARRMGHGSSLGHLMDEGVDRGVVSPSDFD